MITITRTDAFRAIVEDDRLLECALLDLFDAIRLHIAACQPADALFDLIETIKRRHIDRRPRADAIIALDKLRAQIEKGPNR